MKKKFSLFLLAILGILILITGCGGGGSGSSNNSSGSPKVFKIAFVSSKSGAANIWVINSDGTGLTQLTHSSPSTTDRDDEYTSPVISPDGKKIAYSWWHDTGTDYSPLSIYIMGIDGSNPTKISMNDGKSDTTKYDDDFPTWAPDCTTIYCLSSYNTDSARKNPLEIASINVNNLSYPKMILNLNNLSGVTTSVSGDLRCSPDGSKIVFEYILSSNEYSDLCIINSDGSGDLKNITSTASSNQDNVTPNWSPDGTQIYFTNTTNDQMNTCKIYRVNSDGSGLTPITADNNLAELGPAFSPDGTQMLCYTEITAQNKYGLYFINPQNGKTLSLITDYMNSDDTPFASTGTLSSMRVRKLKK
ncbi:MAG TPA: hypothetical protein DDW50_19785 [Firmicutes bacterium]|jgi:Tol biopolymer transport system component|nr:hypothetical protein [Bacillota bacterium]